MRFSLISTISQLVESSANDSYYRLELIDAFGYNCGGLFTSRALWDLIYEDDEDEDAIALESLIDELQGKHSVPTKWLGDSVKFAFKQEFFNENKNIIDSISNILYGFSYELKISEVFPTTIVFEDDTQIAYT